MIDPWATPPASTRILGWSEAAAPPSWAEVEEALRCSEFEVDSVELLESSSSGGTALARSVDAPAILVSIDPSDGGKRDASAPEAVACARWELGLETLLPPAGDLSGAEVLVQRLVSMHRALARLGCGLASLDVDTGRWRFGTELDRFIDGPPPASEELWTVRVHRRQDRSGTWLATEGLCRCGKFELELLAVPESLAPAAAGLLDAVAPLYLEGAPPAGDEWSIGPGVSITLRPLEEVIVRLPPESIGHSEDRRALGASGPRAVICEVLQPNRSEPGSFTPFALLEQAALGAVALHRSGAEAQRLRKLVAAQGPLLVFAADAVGRHLDGHGGLDSGPRLLVALAESGREVSWAEVVGRAASGLLARPVDTAGRAVPGLPAAVAPIEAVIDWRLMISGAEHGPMNPDSAIDAVISWSRARSLPS